MGISFKAEHLKRYKDIARLLWKYGDADWVKHLDLNGDAFNAPKAGDRSQAARAEELASDLESMGPTFIKLGQLLSSRADLLPLMYLDALSRLQDHVEPFSFEEVERTVSAELAVRFSRAFLDFDPKPLAAASLGQVHRATLRDGRAVVVKVQRPGIRERIATDFDAMHEIAELLDRHTEVGKRYGFQRQLGELRKTLWNELDYRLEAANLRTLAENLKDFPLIVVPLPVDDYTTSRVLTMDYIRGVNVGAVSPLVLTEVNTTELVAVLFEAYLKQILIDGFFHADPHPGNIHLTEDRRLALLDLGSVARLTPGLQQDLLKLILAISEGRGEDAADVAIAFGEAREEFDRAEFKRRVSEFVAEHQSTRVGEMQTGRVILEIQRMAADTGIWLPQPLTNLGKALMNLDQVGRILDPKFDPNAAIRRNSMSMVRQRMTKNLTLGALFQTFLETTEFVQHLPKRVNAVFDALTNKEYKFTIDAIDEKYLLKGIHKVANRITAGLVLAALIIGAALLMRVETPFVLFGYPGLAILLFGAATCGGIALLIAILLHDHRHEREVRSPSKRQKT